MQLLGYTPDIDPTTLGTITACSSFVPNDRAMQAAPSAQNVGAAALASACYGCATVIKNDNTFRVFAGTLTKLYELSSLSYSDVTRAVGGNYGLGADNFWSFAQFGDTTLAVAKTDYLQASSSGAFATVATAPKAAIVETVGKFCFLFNTNEASYGDSPNRWWCAAQGSYSDWTPAISTLCATGILTSVPGRIFAAKRFGAQIAVYKERGLYLGTFVGVPEIWNFQLIPGSAGCSSNEAVVDIGTADNPFHIFMGADDFFIFDGSTATPVGGSLRKTVYAELDTTYAYRIKTLHDRYNSRVYFYYPTLDSAGAIFKCVVYNYRSKKWGRDDRTIEAAMQYIAGGKTYDNLGSTFSTYDSIPTTLSYDSTFWTSGKATVAFYDTSHTLYSLNAIPTGCTFTLGDLGDDNSYYLLSRVKPRWLTKPSYAAMTNYYKDSEGDDLISDIVTPMSSSRFDVLRSARWHRLQFNTTGPTELNDVEAVYQPDGSE